MTKLINAAYSRIEGAPLRAGFATPFSTPRNADTGSKTTEDTKPQDAYWSREEYVERDPPLTDASFYSVLDYAQRAGAKDDARRPFDRIGFVVRFILGVGLGVLLSFNTIVKDYKITTRGAVAVFIFLPLGCGVASGFGGDRFWRIVRPVGWWFWGRWN